MSTWEEKEALGRTRVRKSQRWDEVSENSLRLSYDITTYFRKEDITFEEFKAQTLDYRRRLFLNYERIAQRIRAQFQANREQREAEAQINDVSNLSGEQGEVRRASGSLSDGSMDNAQTSGYSSQESN